MNLEHISFQACKAIIVTFTCLLLIGCVGFVTQPKPSEEVSFFIQKSKDLKLGMTKAKLHSMVGSPYLSSEHLKFEIFQIISEGKEHAIMILPVPLWVYENQDYIPVLMVTYHDDWTVKDYEWGIYDESETSNRKNVLIELDGYTLIRTEPKLTGMMLFAPADVSEQMLLEPLLTDQCVLYLIVPDQPIELKDNQYYSGLTKLFIDDKLLLDFGGFPYSNSLMQIHFWSGVISDTVFIGFQLPEGVHELELRGHVKEDSIKGRYTCVAGKTNFANIRADIIDVWREQGWTFGYRYRVKGEININDNWPKGNKDRRQILMYRDTWYGMEHQK